MSQNALNRRFLLLQGLLTLIECVSTSYISPILVSMGCTARQIGATVALAALAAALCRPVWGFLNDRYSCVRQVLFGGTAVGIGCYFLLTHCSQLLWAAVSVMGLHITIFCMMNFVDSWALRLISCGYHLNYGGTRAGGSFSYAVGAVLLGILITRHGFRPANYVLWVLFVLLVWVAWSIPAPPHTAQAEQQIRLRDGLSALASVGAYRLMLIAFFLCTLSSSAMESFYSVLLLKNGGTEQVVGLALFIQAMSEIPIMVGYTKLRKATGLSPAALMGVSMVCYGCKAFLMGIASTLPLMVAAAALQAFSFALFTPASIDFMLCTVPETYLATAHLVFLAVGQSVATVLGNLFWGPIADSIGVSLMFRFAALPALAAGLLAFYIAKTQKKENDHVISGV